MEDKKFITMPQGCNRYHIFDGRNISLCGKWAIIFPKKEDCEEFTGKEVFSNKQDCKTCFRKAGLIAQVRP